LSDPFCEDCGDEILTASHLVEAFEITGKWICSDCWDFACANERSCELKDNDPEAA
jgi:hypothetical protein